MKKFNLDKERYFATIVKEDGTEDNSSPMDFKDMVMFLKDKEGFTVYNFKNLMKCTALFLKN